MAARPAAALTAAFEARGVTWGPYQSLSQAVAGDPYFNAAQAAAAAYESNPDMAPVSIVDTTANVGKYLDALEPMAWISPAVPSISMIATFCTAVFDSE